jgi:hypothetical protein
MTTQISINSIFKKTTILWVIAFSLHFNVWLSAQTTADFIYKIRVDEVDFAPQSDAPTYKLNMVRDYSPNPPITGVAWKYPDTRTPVAFVSGKNVRVSAKFDLGGCTKAIYAKGENLEGHIVPAKPLVNGTYPLTDLNLGSGLMNRVKFFDPFTITWFISTTASGPWIEAGKSNNPLYIVLKQPQTSPLYHSLIFHSCKSAKEKTSENDVVNSIYNGTFTNRSVPRKDNPTFLTGMKYWAWPEPTGQAQPSPQLGFYFSTKDLLKYENGRCQAWAMFFQDMIAAHGISGSQLSIVKFLNSNAMNNAFTSDLISFFGTEISNITLSNPFYEEIFVKKFNFNTAKFYKWNREWKPTSDLRNSITLTNGNLLTYAPDDEETNPAQGNTKPMSTFENHAIIKYH